MKIEGIKLVLGILLFIEPFFFQPKWKWMYGLLWLLAISLIMTKLAVVGYGLFFLINLFLFWKYKQKTVSVGCLSAIGVFLAFGFPEGEKILLLLMLLSVHHEPVLPQLNLPMSVLSYLMDGLFLVLFFLGKSPYECSSSVFTGTVSILFFWPIKLLVSGNRYGLCSITRSNYGKLHK